MLELWQISTEQTQAVVPLNLWICAPENTNFPGPTETIYGNLILSVSLLQILKNIRHFWQTSLNIFEKSTCSGKFY